VSFRRRLRTTRTKISLTVPLHYDNPAKYNLLSLYSHLYQWTSLLFLRLLVTPNKSSMPSPEECKKTKFFSSTYWKSKLHATLQLHYGCFYFHDVRHFQHNYNSITTIRKRSFLVPRWRPRLPQHCPGHGTSFFFIRPLFFLHSGTADNVSIFTSKYWQWPRICDTFTFPKSDLPTSL